MSQGTWVSVTSQTEMEQVITHLRHAGYTPLIRSMVTGMLTAAGIKGTDDPELIQSVLIPDLSKTDPSDLEYEETHSKELLGDLFVASEVICGIRSRISLSPVDTRTEIYAVGDGKQTEALSKFCTEVEDAIKSSLKYIDAEKIKFSWKPTNPFLSNELHDIILTERGIMDSERCLIRKGRITLPDYTDEEAQATIILLDAERRGFLVSLAKEPRMTEKDVWRKTMIDPLRTLISSDLVRQEYLLTCRLDQHNICTVPSLQSLATESKARQVCSVCGRPFAQENLQIVYSLTNKGTYLTEGNLWMYIWVTELLKRNGVENEAIAWKAEAAGEDIDIVVEDFGSRFLFELKDKEFGLGDAYTFANRVPRFGGNVGIVLTMNKVAAGAKDFFQEKSSSIRVWCLEGVDQIQKQFKAIVERMALLHVRRLAKAFSDATTVDLWPVVEQLLSKRSEDTIGEKDELG